MGRILNLKNFFNRREKPHSFKWPHYLNRIARHKLEEIILFSEGDHLNTIWPEFEKKKILFLNDQKHKYIFKKVLSEEPGHLVNYIYKGEDVTEQKPEFHTVLGDIDKPAIRKNHFDIVISPLALEDSPFVETFIRTIGGFLENGGRLVLSVRHPQLENILHNQNPASTQVQEGALAKYFSLLRENHLFTEEIKEGPVDLALKAFFTDSEFDYYHEYKNTPVTLLFRAVKFVRKNAATKV